MLKLDFYKKYNCPIKENLILKTAKIFSAIYGKKKGEAEVIVVSDSEIRKINRLYRGKNKITDVLSFAFREDKNIKTDFWGQIFICYPQIKRQAKLYNVGEKEEFVRMLAHGLLHLVGYDHDIPKKEKKMFSLQEKIVKRIV